MSYSYSVRMSFSTRPMSASPGRKRKRVSHRTDATIYDLPNEAITNVASYLNKPSRALLALALTTDAQSWRTINWDKKSGPMLSWVKVATSKKGRPSEATRVIVAGEKWDVLDFGEAEESLLAKLRDDDVAGVLACVDALRNIKIVKLSGLVNLRGWGLQPLGGSSVLEQIDLVTVVPAYAAREQVNVGKHHYWLLSEELSVHVTAL